MTYLTYFYLWGYACWAECLCNVCQQHIHTPHRHLQANVRKVKTHKQDDKHISICILYWKEIRDYFLPARMKTQCASSSTATLSQGPREGNESWCKNEMKKDKDRTPWGCQGFFHQVWVSTRKESFSTIDQRLQGDTMKTTADRNKNNSIFTRTG